MSSYPTWVTLYTDANPHAWGAYARADAVLCRRNPDHLEPRVEGKGVFDASPLDMTLAECRAILEGYKMVLNYWEGVKGIGVRTDSQAAIKVLIFGAKPHRREDLRLVQEEARDILKGSIKSRLRWVKGHQDPYLGSVQAWLNHRVDRHASKARAVGAGK